MCNAGRVIPPKPASTAYHCNIPQERFGRRSNSLEDLSSHTSSDLHLKSPKDWTQSELQDAMKSREVVSNDAEKRAMFQRERQWFEANYGNGEVYFDET